MFAVRERMTAPMTALKSVSRPFIGGKGHTLSGAIPSLSATESLTDGMWPNPLPEMPAPPQRAFCGFVGVSQAYRARRASSIERSRSCAARPMDSVMPKALPVMIGAAGCLAC
jgi:hypothetical protein